MKKYARLAGMVVLSACGNGGGGGGGGNAEYRIEFSGSLNAGASFQGIYSTSGGQTELFASALPANKTITAKANEFVLADGSVMGGGTLKVKVFKNNTLCEEKTLTITSTGSLSAACNRFGLCPRRLL